MNDEMLKNLVSDLISYFNTECADENESLFTLCAKRAINSFRTLRGYPKSFKEDSINKDMENYYYCLFDLAVYWYSKIGAEYENSHSENGTSRSWSSEKEIYAAHGVVPFANVF